MSPDQMQLGLEPPEAPRGGPILQKTAQPAQWAGIGRRGQIITGGGMASNDLGHALVIAGQRLWCPA